MGTAVSAPFTTNQVASLNAYQTEGAAHPFTCGVSGCREALKATAAGWVCPRCDYRQTLAHAFMADGSWQRRERA
jgi:hypothetical protein